MIIAKEDYLEHFGVKGMRWGVRRQKRGEKDVSLPKGTKVVNISARTPRNLKAPIYTAHKPKDILNYRANYASSQTFVSPNVFSNAFITTKAVRAAGAKTQVAAFKKLWNENPERMAKALAESKKDLKFAAAFNARILKIDRTDVYQKRILKKGSDWVETKGLRDFNASLAINQINLPESDKKRGRKIDGSPKQAYFKELTKRGYNAVVDLNDVDKYGSEEPLLIFKPSALQRSGKPIKLTEKQMSIAWDQYMNLKTREAFQDKLHE